LHDQTLSLPVLQDEPGDHLAVMLYIRFPLSLRNVDDLLHERGIEVSQETVRFWWNRFGPIFATEIRGKCAEAMRPSPLAVAPGQGR
jgi:transposase-like protein